MRGFGSARELSETNCRIIRNEYEYGGRIKSFLQVARVHVITDLNMTKVYTIHVINYKSELLLLGRVKDTASGVKDKTRDCWVGDLYQSICQRANDVEYMICAL
jgi:hypothetical protein